MDSFTRKCVAGALMTLGVLAAGPAARGGITIQSADVQPIGDPRIIDYINLVIEPNTTVNVGDFIHIDSVPFIGNGGSNLVKVPPDLPFFINLFDTPSSPFFGSFIFATDPNDTSLSIIYTGFYNRSPDYPTSIVTGPDQTLVVPVGTLGVETVDFPADTFNTPAFQSELTAPWHYTSSTNGVTVQGNVDPVITPEPATVVMVLSSLPVALLAYRRLRSRRVSAPAVR